MAEMVSRFDNVRRIYSSDEGRLRFRPSQELEDALRGMIQPQSRLGRSALFLYSPAQVYVRRYDSEALEPSEQLNSQVRSHISMLGSHQYPLARSIVPKVELGETQLQFAALLDTLTQTQLHDCLPYGLNQTLFGRKVLEVSLLIPHTDIVSSREERLDASREIKRIIWGADDLESPHDPLNPPSDKAARVTGIDWVITKR